MSIRSVGTLLPTLLVALAGAWLARTAVAQPLTLDRALELARARSQAVVAQDSAAAAARELAVAAGQLPDPTLTVGINNLPVTGPDRFSLTDDFMTMRSIGVMQEFTREGKRKARSARYEREAESAEAGKQLAVANLSRDTALAWLDRYYQEIDRHDASPSTTTKRCFRSMQPRQPIVVVAAARATSSWPERPSR